MIVMMMTMMMMMMMPDDKDDDDGDQEVNGWVGLEQETELLPIESNNLLGKYPHHLPCIYHHHLLAEESSSAPAM